MAVAAIKVDVSIGQPFVVGGKVFSLNTDIFNCHEKTIEIVCIIYHVPYQMVWLKDEEYIKALTVDQDYPWYSRGWHRRRIFKQAKRLLGMEMYNGILPDPLMPVQALPAIMAIPSAQHGSYAFKALVPEWIFLNGSNLSFPGRLVYRCDGQLYSETFDVKFDVRPPLRSIALGAVIGAGTGSFARLLKQSGVSLGNYNSSQWIAFFTTTTLSLILATIVVIYSSRRSSDAQPILTVEDFFGGLLIGFTLGWTGNEMFDKMVPSFGEK